MSANKQHKNQSVPGKEAILEEHNSLDATMKCCDMLDRSLLPSTANIVGIKWISKLNTRMKLTSVIKRGLSLLGVDRKKGSITSRLSAVPHRTLIFDWYLLLLLCHSGIHSILKQCAHSYQLHCLLMNLCIQNSLKIFLSHLENAYVFAKQVTA